MLNINSYTGKTKVTLYISETEQNWNKLGTVRTYCTEIKGVELDNGTEIGTDISKRHLLVKGDILIVSELNQFGRQIYAVIGAINELIQKGIRVIIVRQNLDFNGKEDDIESIIFRNMERVSELELKIIPEGE